MYLYGLQMDKQTYNPTNEHTLTKMSILESDKHKWNEIKKNMLLTSFATLSLHIWDFPVVNKIPNKSVNLRSFDAKWPVIVTTADDSESPATMGSGCG